MNNEISITKLLKKVNTERIWNKEPVFCFTSDVDWASESVLDIFLNDFCKLDLKLTLFVTHESEIINQFKAKGFIERGIHPNFLPNSSHGEGFRTVIENCLKFAPEAECFRSHRFFDVTDITHLLHDEYGFKYASNLGTIMQPEIRPILHESGLIRFPVFFEDGTHLYHKLDLNIEKYLKQFTLPGIKIISIHPMNYVINVSDIKHMRSIKDTLSGEEYNSMTTATINQLKNRNKGIKAFVKEIVTLAKQYKILSLNELYQLTIL